MNEIVTSHDNPTIKLIKSLKIKKYRDKHGLYMVEGIKMAREALDQKINIHMLIFSEDFHIGELGLHEEEQLIPNIRVASNLFKEVSDVQSPQGVIALLNKEEYPIDMIDSSGPSFWVVLDEVQDPGNMGTIIRTVDAAGGNGVILLKGCVDPYNPKTIRATMGSIFRVPIIQVRDTGSFLNKLKEIASDILVSSMDGKSIFNWKDSRSKGITALVIGNESKGISEEVGQFATDVVSIPIVGGAESLNASVAAGILIYEIMKKQGNIEQENS
ncbi:MAG TPA: RNA methyltransferase [Clostridia bacterium]|nr:RNA methyltransferase [Clostridia bacterium]